MDGEVKNILADQEKSDEGFLGLFVTSDGKFQDQRNDLHDAWLSGFQL